MMNREEYLNNGVKALNALFKAQDYDLPDVRVSCSWPGGRGNKNKTIGQCWPCAASDAKVNEIFISPVIDDAVKALDVLTHELVHAIDDCTHGHRKEFTKIMRAIGLEGKPTSTNAGERLHAELVKIADKLGVYPHHKLNPSKPKQKSRQLKASCNDCSALWRMSKKWLELSVCCPVCQSKSITIT